MAQLLAHGHEQLRYLTDKYGVENAPPEGEAAGRGGPQAGAAWTPPAR